VPLSGVPDRAAGGRKCLIEIRRCPARAFGLIFRWDEWGKPLLRTEVGPLREVVNLSEKLATIQKHWDPKVVGALNGQEVKLAKVKGDFIWHHHENEDELFFVVEGVLRLEFRDGAVEVGPGELYIVPRGVEHRPVAVEEAHIMMFEPASTLNTGNIRNELTVEKPERI
jgi:mannose-6-phosphate isomerase-like protein (cupin superfamily)